MKDIMEYKEAMFLYVRKYYLWFMKEDRASGDFPVFKFGER